MSSDEPGDRPVSGMHVPALDGLRGLAVLLVTLYRFGHDPADNSVIGRLAHPLFAAGESGVDLFFVLSGFLITGILADTKERSHYLRNFYMRRVLRIFPLYYGGLALAFWGVTRLATIPEFVDVQSRQGWLWTYCANFLISWEGEWCLGPFNHFWSLAVEEHFYLIWPWVILAVSRTTAMRVAAVLAISSALARTLWMISGGSIAAGHVFTLFRLDGLLLGAWLAIAIRGPTGYRPLIPVAKWLLVISGIGLAPVVIFERRLMFLPVSLYAIFYGSLLVLVVNASRTGRWGRFWQSGPLRTLGKYSYGIYVFQNPLIPLMGIWFTAESLAVTCGSITMGRFVYVVLMSATTMLVAFASWHLFEKHFLQLKKYFGGSSSVEDSRTRSNQLRAAERASTTS